MGEEARVVPGRVQQGIREDVQMQTGTSCIRERCSRVHERCSMGWKECAMVHEMCGFGRLCERLDTVMHRAVSRVC